MPRLAIFIDGGYLDRVRRDEFSGMKIDYLGLSKLIAETIDPDIDLLRTYFYHCLPYQSNPPIPEESQRFASVQKFFDTLRRLPRFEVREGILARYGPGANGSYYYQQKRIDALLSVDLVQLAAKHLVDHAALIAGDSDFLPAVNVARDEGVSIWLFHGRSVHNELWACADERVKFTANMIERIRL